MPSYQKYQSGAYETIGNYHPSAADNANSTQVVVRAPHKGTLLAAYYVPTASINSETAARAYYIINGGSAGTGTTILASQAATASKLAFTPISLTTQASCSFSASDVITFQTSKSSNASKAMAAGVIQIDWRFER